MSTLRLELRSTRRLLALCALLIFVPLGLLAYLSVHLATGAVKSDAKSEVRSNAAMAANTFSSAMTSFTGSLASFADRPSVQAAAGGRFGAADRQTLSGQLAQLRKSNPTVAGASFVSAAGQTEVASSATVGLPEPATLHNWYLRVVKTGRPYISPAYRSSAAGHPNVIAVAVPIRGDGGRPVGSLLVATFGLAATQQFVDYFASSLGIQLTLTDQRGVMLAGAGNKRANLVALGSDPGVAAALRNRSSVREHSTAAGSMLSAYAPVAGIGWTVAAGIPTTTAFSRIDSLRSTVFVVTGIMALLLIAGLALLARALSQRERAERLAERARDEAEQANQAKSEFLSRMSHELRTPLNAVLGFGQLLATSELDAPDRESVDQILKGGEHLLALINEILDIARIEAGKLTLSLEPVEIRETISEALAFVQPLAADRRIDITLDVPAQLYVVADRQRLSQVLLNLLSNAIKYNRPQGSVHVAAENSGAGTVRIRVTDTGRGIAAADLARLYTPFERLDAERSQIEGTGLGLTLSKGLVEAMGGSVHVESQVGEGSTFTVEFAETANPLAKIDSAPAATPALASLQQTSRRYKILYIEDNLSNLKLVQRILAGRSDVELIPAMQGSLGLELAIEHRPDLVLLDLHLPDMQGDEVLRRLQANPAFNGTPVVVLSADATKGRITRVLEQGANAYLSKPINVQQFLELIEQHIPRTLPDLVAVAN
jgi:signal transduction histidine kinase/ActR/RegA family two-component response regulator